jgi:glucokinase
VETALAIDIGGTKLAVARVDAEGRLTDRHMAPTPGLEGAEVMWGTLVDLVAASRRGDEVVVGVGCGGPMAPGGVTVSPLNIPAWREFPLRARLVEETGLDVHIDNDAKALARGEGWVGVSTGVGGGIVVDGRLLDGATGNAGHVGHVIVEPDGRVCACGARGCLEAEASGPSILAAGGVAPTAVGEDVRRRTGMLVGRAVASVVNLLDLRLAVVGGSVALGFGAPFFEAAQAELEARARIDYARGARIVPVGLGDEGPLVGAAAVGWHGLGRDLAAVEGRG